MFERRPSDEDRLKADLLERLYGDNYYCPDGQKMEDVYDWFVEDPRVVQRIIEDAVSDNSIPIYYADLDESMVCVSSDINIQDEIWKLI